MKFNKNLAALHSYLCADGYVIKNPPTQKHKYYRIALRNTNPILLKDFQQNFESYFRIKPKICKDGRCRIESKQIYEFLTKDFSYYCEEWVLPKLNRNNLVVWLRKFYDCEGWIENYKYNRAVKVESKNFVGLQDVEKALNSLGIKTTGVKGRKKRIIWRLSLFGRDNLIKFKDVIGFTHPGKKRRLVLAIRSFK